MASRTPGRARPAIAVSLLRYVTVRSPGLLGGVSPRITRSYPIRQSGYNAGQSGTGLNAPTGMRSAPYGAHRQRQAGDSTRGRDGRRGGRSALTARPTSTSCRRCAQGQRLPRRLCAFLRAGPGPVHHRTARTALDAPGDARAPHEAGDVSGPAAGRVRPCLGVCAVENIAAAQRACTLPENRIFRVISHFRALTRAKID